MELRAEEFRGVQLEVEKKYANTVSSEVISEEVGLFLNGKIITDRNDPSRIRIENGGLRYGREAGLDSGDDLRFSLTTQINLSGFGFFNMDLELGKPKMLFDINTIEITKDKGRGLFFWNNKRASKHLNPVSYTHLTLPTICSV